MEDNGMTRHTKDEKDARLAMTHMEKQLKKLF